MRPVRAAARNLDRQGGTAVPLVGASAGTPHQSRRRLLVSFRWCARVDVSEVVTEKDLYCIRIMTELSGDARPASGYLSDLLSLFLLELHLESCHVYHPINAVAPPCAPSLSKVTHENVLCGYLRH